jgi:type IV secretory pathway VirB2 component (pilin)
MSTPVPTEKEREEKVNKALESKVGRFVAGIVIPLALPLATAVSYYLQKWFGLKLAAGPLAAYLGTVVAGLAITGYKWLEGRSQWERTVLEVSKLYEVGSGK